VSEVAGFERIESTKLLDCRLIYIVIAPHYEDETNTGTPAGQNGTPTNQKQMPL
jgi:hypothetical protein